jgi:hypothetical protein
VFLGLLGAALIVVFFAGAGLGMGLTGAPTAVSVLLAGVLLLLAAALWKRFPPFMQAFGAVLAWIVAAFLVIETGALITIWQTGDESAETEDTGRFRTSWEPYLGMRTVPAGGWTIAPGVPAMRTVPRAAPDSVNAFEVWLLGGDMAWGGPMDDDSTLAAALQRKLDEHTGRPVRVVCAAQPQYVTTQELLQLALGLRDGGRPDLVVCLHGYDDIISAHTLSVAGDPMAMSRMRGESETGMSAAEALSAYTGAGRLLGQLLAGDEDTGPPAPREGSMPPKIMARRITRTAMVNQELIEALCRTRGARAAFFWQPTLWTADRQLTDAEQGLRQTASVRPDRLGELVREVYSRVDSLSVSLSRTWVLEDALTGEGEMFAGPSTLTGRGSERLAAEMVETLERAGLI